MNSFDRMGEALLLGVEGQQEIARTMAKAVGRGVARLARRFTHASPRA